MAIAIENKSALSSALSRAFHSLISRRIDALSSSATERVFWSSSSRAFVLASDCVAPSSSTSFAEATAAFSSSARSFFTSRSSRAGECELGESMEPPFVPAPAATAAAAIAPADGTDPAPPVPVTEEAESFVSGCVGTAVAAVAAAAAVAFFATVVFDELVDEVDVFTGEAFGTVAFMPVVDAFGGGAPDAASREVALFPGIVEEDAAVGGAVDGDDDACSIDFTGRSAESAAIAGGAALLT